MTNSQWLIIFGMLTTYSLDANGTSTTATQQPSTQPPVSSCRVGKHHEGASCSIPRTTPPSKNSQGDNSNSKGEKNENKQ